METRTRKKVSVTFFHDSDIKHIIQPLGQKIKTSSEHLRKPTWKSREEKKKQKYKTSSDEEVDDTLTEEVVDSNHQVSKKSTVLFDDGDVSGEQMFGFKTSLRKNNLSQKVQESIRLSSLSSSPVNGNARTPNTIRNRIKKQIAKKVEKQELASSSSSSEFSPSEEDSASDDESPGSSTEPSERDDSDEKSVTKTPVRSKTILKLPTINKTPVVARDSPAGRLRQRRLQDHELDYVLNADEYFSRSLGKSLTSNHTLGRLKTPRLPPDQLKSLLSQTKPSHEKPVSALYHQLRDLFPKWMFILSEGFSIVVYGVGSTRDLLNAFHAEMLSDWPVLVVNGFFPSLSIKEIIDSIVESILELKERPRKLLDAVEAIERAFHSDDSLRMGLVIHNIDGPMLRGSKTQEILSRLAKLSNVRLITSVDHINGPAIWDQSKLGRFNFSWWDSTTLLPYVNETSYEGSLLVQRSGALALSSLSNVFRSLTTNARGIFKVILRYQLDHTKGKGSGQYMGMLFKDLYRLCREAMLVSTDTVLRTQLTEFLDHQLLVAKRGRGGSEVLLVPISESILQQFLEQMDDSDS